MGILTIWIHSRPDPDNDSDPDQSNSIHSEFPKTSVHKTIEKWHLSDPDGKIPFFFSLHNSKFSAYPVERLSHWSEVPLHQVRCPGQSKSQG
jgi:hypothetical protein